MELGMPAWLLHSCFAQISFAQGRINISLMFVWFCGALALFHRLREEGGIQL